MRFLILLFLFSLEAGFAQGIFSPFPETLKAYLELTDQQVSQILAKNQQLGEYRSAKLVRQYAVKFEIAEETGRAVVDPMAIGVRYLELETIRRELETEANKIVAEIQGLLTPAQKTKLIMLEGVLRQQNTACSAVSWNLILEPSVPGNFAAFLLQSSQVGCANQPHIGVFLPGVILGNKPGL